VRSVAEITTPTVNRAGCFAQFAVATENYREANNLIRTILPSEYAVKLSDEEDFVLQVNHPRQVGERKMNFITKWAVERLQVLSLQVTPGMGQASALGQLVSEHIVGTVSFDNSNSPIGLLSKEDLVSILDEALSGISDGQRKAQLDLEGF
jgi:hypothetical protein